VSKSWGDVKTRPSLLRWPPEVVILQCDLERAEEMLARARTDAELGAAKLAVAEAAARLEAAKREELARCSAS
jgi:hypothetical protein